MRFLVINPPYVIGEEGKAVRPNKAMLPVGPLSIGQALRERGHEIRFLDLVFEENWQGVLAEATEWLPDQVLISCHTVRNIDAVRAVLAVIRSRLGDIHVTLGGNVCTDLGREEFNKLGVAVAAVVRGYGHGLIPRIIARETGDLFPNDIPSELPIPDLSLLPAAIHEKYREHSRGKYPIIGPGGFGCRWNCGYCSAKMKSGFVERQLANIVAEARQTKEYGYTHLWCVDNVVLTDPDVALEFAREVAALGFEWSAMTRAETVTDLALLEKIRDHGLVELAMGVETLSAKTLNFYRRGAKSNYSDHLRRAFELVNKTGITSNAFVMLDGPAETEADFWNLYNFLAEVKPGTISWSFYNPPPQLGLTNGHRPADYGFYRWPFGCSEVLPELVAQQAMVLAGRWWCGWHLEEAKPFFDDGERFGVRFKETLLFQDCRARSAIGDLWEVWEEEE